uniref:Uncharacterized protein n=1 Tax=Rhizochromulina marina TaxID=1034831 RepID=A0A7S2RHD7_9STRA
MQKRPYLLLSCLVIGLGLADEFAFFDACASGDAVALVELAPRVDLNYADENGDTPLLLAVKGNHSQAVEVLLGLGADVELAAEYPADVDTPLTAAARYGLSHMAALLVARGAAIDGQGRDGRTALMAAAAHGHRSTVTMLREKGAQVDAMKKDGTSALCWAARAGRASLVLDLIQAGAKVDRADFVDRSQPIHFACQEANENTKATLQHLLTFGADANARTGILPPLEANGKPKENPERDELEGGMTPLMVAAYAGNIVAVELLLGSIGTSTVQGVPAVDLRDVRGQTAIVYAAMSGNDKVIDVLVARGADPDLPSADGRAALHHAAFAGHLAAVKALIAGGATVDQPAALSNGAGSGHSALLLASHEGHLKVIRCLLKNGAAPNAASKDGATPLIAAAAGSKVKAVRALLKAGADPARRLASGETAAMLTSDREISSLLYHAQAKVLADEQQANMNQGDQGEHDEEEELDVAEEDEEDEEEGEGSDDPVPGSIRDHGGASQGRVEDVELERVDGP